jgi:hypothetical protein
MLGTAFPYLVRERFAARRWLFERNPDGSYRLRGERTRNWLGWPESSDANGPKPRLFGNSKPESSGISRD